MFDVNQVPEHVRKYLKPTGSCYMNIVAIGKDSHVIMHDMPEFDDLILEDWSPFYWNPVDKPKPKDENEDGMTLADVMWVVFTQSKSAIWEMSVQDIADLAYYYHIRKSHIMLSYLFDILYAKAVDGDRIVIRFYRHETDDAQHLINDSISWLDDMDHPDDPYHHRDKEEKHGSVTNP